MSPARARTSIDAIVAAGRALLEDGGVNAVTMLAVAERVGVRAPSLYKRLRNRNELLAAIASATLQDLNHELEPLGRDPDPAAGLRAIAFAFRAFAHRRPREYELLFANLPPDARAPTDQNELAAAPVISLASRLVGTGRALDAARTMTAFVHGFISMELSGAFRLGGDVDEAFQYGLDVVVDSLARAAPRVGNR